MSWEIVGESGARYLDDTSAHLPVMSVEVLSWLRPHSGGVYVDCTVGYCGHALQVLEACQPQGRILGIDRDAQAIKTARQQLLGFGERAMLVNARFVELKQILAERGVPRVDGILFDLGVSSPQLDDASRGFSFRLEGPLDMRMDQSRGQTAADIVNGFDEASLADLIYRFGEERYSRRIARAIVAARGHHALTSTRELVSVIESSVPGYYRRGRIHCATRTFQALRIAVNEELSQLEPSFRDAADALVPGARLCVISFHSLEDRIVKQTFRALASHDSGEFQILTKRPQVPSDNERNCNPRSRSAKLRVIERTLKEGRV